MKVRIHPGDEHGVGNYRMRYPAFSSGVEIDEAKGLPIVRLIRKSDHRPVIAPQQLDADVLVFQRPSSRELVSLIPALQAQGHAVVVDVDDDLSAIHAKNVAAGSEEHRMVLRACQAADMVTVSTIALAQRYAPHGRVRVLANCVPERLLDMPRDADGRTVGWAGWVGTHPEDLQVTRGAVQTALDVTGARFQMVGPADGVNRALQLRDSVNATGGLPLDEYYEALGMLDVGIAPLHDSVFNRAKSRLKPLEMTARGIAVAMSPRPDYVTVHQTGVGVIVPDRSRSWRSALVNLLLDERARAELVACGQQAIREHHTYEGQGWRWAEAWEDALVNRHGSGRLAA